MQTEKIEIKSQYDHRIFGWKIVKQTKNGAGGWANFGTSPNNKFETKSLADKAVVELCKLYGGLYEEA